MNVNSVYRREPITYTRFEPDIESGVVFLYHRGRRTAVRGNAAVHEVWSLLDGVRSGGEIAARIRDSYTGLSPEAAIQRVCSTLKTLADAGMISHIESRGDRGNEQGGDRVDTCAEFFRLFLDVCNDPSPQMMAGEFEDAVVQYVLSRRAAGLSSPIRAVWDITNRCNLSCVFCSVWNYVEASGKELNTAGCHRVVDQLHDAGVMRVELQGGEPFMRDDLVDVVSHLTASVMAVPSPRMPR